MSPSAAEVVRRAPAKVNLWLAVHGRRADGYHELSTLMLALEWADELRARVSSRPGLRLELSGPAASPDVPRDERNLVWRAAREALERVRGLGRGAPPGLELVLDKQVPSQAGLGGGSSDAVAALTAVEELLGVELGLDWKRALCARLGADCSFFLEVGESGLALCEGIGERVRPWPGPRPGWRIALLVPEVRCPTAAVFEALSLAPGPRREPPFDASLAQLPPGELRARLGTDLEAAACRAVPELRAWRDLLEREGAAHFRLSGSGSAFFGVFSSGEAARARLEALLGAAERAGLTVRSSRVSCVFGGMDAGA